MSRFLFSFIVLTLISYSGTKAQVAKNTTLVPIIIFDQETIDIGKIKRGEKRDVVFNFTNTGTANLEIEVMTA